VRALPEDRLFFADEPVLEVAALSIQARLVGTATINQLDPGTVLATKASWATFADVFTRGASCEGGGEPVA
jgi:nicotinic acid phosphoribosyltransferase